MQFFDETRKIVECILSNPNKSMVCYWDHNPLVKTAIYCPIRYKPKQIVKTYTSEISNEKYTIKENIPTDQTVSSACEDGMSVIPEEYEVDGIFCSPNCCLAFILDNKHNKLYDQSEMLLYKNLTASAGAISPAPHWRMLKEYGGSMDIKDFRKSFKSNEISVQVGTTLEPTKILCYLYTKVPAINIE